MALVDQFFKSDKALNTPFLYINSRLWATIAQKVRNQKGPRKPKPSDSYDVKAISTYAPYCDAMYVDNEFHSMASQKNVDVSGKFGVRLFSTRTHDSFLAYLDDILKSMSEAHREGLTLLYPHLISTTAFARSSEKIPDARILAGPLSWSTRRRARAAGDQRLATAAFHPRRSGRAFNIPRCGRWSANSVPARKTGSQAQVLLIECQPKRGTEIDSPSLCRELTKRGSAARFRSMRETVWLQKQWGHGQDAVFPVQDARRVKELTDWATGSLRLLFDHLERRQQIRDSQ